MSDARPRPDMQRPYSTGSESVIATALIGEETALLIDSSLFEGEEDKAGAEASADQAAD